MSASRSIVGVVREHPIATGVALAVGAATFVAIFGRPTVGGHRLPGTPCRGGVPAVVFVKSIGNGQVLRWDRAWAWKSMVRAAARDGVKLVANSGLRGMPKQTVLYAEYVARLFTPPKVALPGCSNHQAGDAVDIAIPPAGSAPDDPRRIASKEYQWLVRNAARFGFYNDLRATGETWHWSSTGR